MSWLRIFGNHLGSRFIFGSPLSNALGQLQHRGHHITRVVYRNRSYIHLRWLLVRYLDKRVRLVLVFYLVTGVRAIPRLEQNN
jgi:hypothetical protein